jgi:Peptidase family M23
MPRSAALRTLTATVALTVVSATAACTGAGNSTPAASPTSGAAASPTSGAVSAANPSGGGIAPGTLFTPLVASTYTTPAPVRGTDGATHLAYELALTNALPIPFQLERVDIRDAATHAPVTSESGPALAADVTQLIHTSREAGDPPPPTTEPIAPSSTSVVWLDVTVPNGGPPPDRLEHLVVGSIQPPGAAPVHAEFVVGTVDVAKQTAPVLSWPVGAGDWYMSDGCCADDTHHRRGLAPINGAYMVPQRFAIDFYKLDDQHRAWVGDPSKLASYVTYNQPILAAAAGTVVAALDGLPNNDQLPKPPAIPSIDHTVGNHVIVEVGPGQYLLYAHMDPGSVATKVGDRVEKGQQLGRIGTSGNSTVPHLHFQVLTEPTFFPADSTPYAFDRFELTGRVTQRIWDDIIGLQPDGTMPFEAAADGGARTDEMPLDRAVVRVSAG